MNALNWYLLWFYACFASYHCLYLPFLASLGQVEGLMENVARTFLKMNLIVNKLKFLACCFNRLPVNHNLSLITLLKFNPIEYLTELLTSSSLFGAAKKLTSKIFSFVAWFSTTAKAFSVAVNPSFNDTNIGSAFSPENHWPASKAGVSPGTFGYRSGWYLSD